MRRARSWRLAAVLVAGVAALCAACGAAAQPSMEDKAREYTERFYAGDIVALHALFTDEMAHEIPLPQFQQMYRSVRDQLGAETEVLSETTEFKTPYHRYLRRARFERFAGEIEVNWLLRDDYSIAGVVFRPVGPAPQAPGS